MQQIEYQLSLLNEEAKNFTKEDIESILNFEKQDVQKETTTGLKKLAKFRLKQGLPVLPWTKLEGLQITQEDDDELYGW